MFKSNREHIENYMCNIIDRLDMKVCLSVRALLILYSLFSKIVIPNPSMACISNLCTLIGIDYHWF